MSGLPPLRGANGFGTDIEGHTPPPDEPDWWITTRPSQAGYFDTMRIPIVRGRAFQEADRIGTPVAVVNEMFVRTFWQGLDPVGRRVKPRFGNQTPW